MERTFVIFKFHGIVRNNGRKTEVREMSLKTCLDSVFNTYWDDTTKRLFERNGFCFDSEEFTLSELTEKIGKGLAVFPVSTTQDIEEVKRYIDIGLSPVFMKATDFRAFKKVYGN